MGTGGARIARLREFYARDGENATLACELADALMQDGDVTGASAMLASVSLSLANHPGLRFRQAHIALAQGRYDAAASTYRSLLDSGHDGVSIRHDLAFSLLCQRQADRALEVASQAAIDLGDSAELAILRARCTMMLDAYEAARAHAATAIELAPDSADAHGVAALVCLDDGDYRAAAAASARALTLSVNQHEALIVAGTLALWEMRSNEAAGFFNRALERFPNSGRALSGLGQVQMLSNDMAEATDTLERAVATMPDHIGTWHALAWCQLLQGSVDRAEKAYRSAYELDRNFGDTHGGLALIAALRGQIDNAEQLTKVALRLDPSATTARYAQTLVLDARNDRHRADELMEQLLSTDVRRTDLPVREFAERLRAKLVPTSA